jgi:hypothetical protein
MNQLRTSLLSLTFTLVLIIKHLASESDKKDAILPDYF